ncbi:MAG: phosphatase PAP2 family protein [Pseudoxanthomonas sp.]
MRVRLPLPPLLLSAALLGACASQNGLDHAPAAAASDDRPVGYLGTAIPDSLSLLLPPPAEGSAGFAQDRAVHDAAQAVRNGPRGALATRDADLSFPAAPQVFACALGVPIDPLHTPRLTRLLQRTSADAGSATGKAKDHYRRTRPFVTFNETVCTPEHADGLRRNGSYPSGHSAIGWTWTLILAELAPERSDALFARGRDYTVNRLVCNAHWDSDIIAGREVGAATVARLHADPAFTADLAAARAELARVRRQQLPPGPDCAAEAAALAVPVTGAL